jgi:hypothetical protein
MRHIIHLFSVSVMITLLCAATAGVQSANAATITVMNTNDSGPGSLRQALTEANDGDTIDFSIATPATITLTSGDLLVNKSITITGPGADQLSVDGNAADRVFYISSGKTVTISGLTISDGSANGSYPDDLGAGIFNDHATLTVSNCISAPTQPTARAAASSTTVVSEVARRLPLTIAPSAAIHPAAASAT